MDYAQLQTVVWMVLLVIFWLVFISMPLNIAARILDEDHSLIRAVWTTLMLVCTFVIITAFVPYPVLLSLFLAILVHLIILKGLYETDWTEAFLMWVLTFLIALAIFVFLSVLFDIDITRVPGL